VSGRDGPINAKGSGPEIDDAPSQSVLYIEEEHPDQLSPSSAS